MGFVCWRIRGAYYTAFLKVSVMRSEGNKSMEHRRLGVIGQVNSS